METIIFVPQDIQNTIFKSDEVKPPPILKTISAQAVKKTVAIGLWATSGVVLCLFLLIAGNSGDETIAGFMLTLAALFVGSVVATAIAIAASRKSIPPVLPTPQFICANCGSLLFWVAVDNTCAICLQNAVIPLGTPRADELMAVYHGTVSAKERVEMIDEANRKLLLTLEPAAASGGLAVQLENLASLVRTGAITNDEWQRAKELYLGQPKDKQESALARIQQLHGLCQSGALSTSEFNTVKWDILAKGMAKGMC
jgi:hypothetical protein